MGKAALMIKCIVAPFSKIILTNEKRFTKNLPTAVVICAKVMKISGINSNAQYDNTDGK